MKKIITLCSLIIVLALVITAFTACGDKTEDETTTTTTEEFVELGVVTVEIGEDSAVIKEDGFVVQTLKYPENSDVKFDLAYAKEHNQFIDFNFDGVDDFYIAVSAEDNIINYYCWIYNETTKLYEYSKELSALKNISVDADKHFVISSIKVDGDEKISCYKWVDGVLTLDVSYDSSKDKIPEDVTNVVENNAIGSDTQPTKKPSSDNKETTKKPSGTKETTKKPSGVTTTQPNIQNGVVLNTDSNIDDGWF